LILPHFSKEQTNDGLVAYNFIDTLRSLAAAIRACRAASLLLKTRPPYRRHVPINRRCFKRGRAIEIFTDTSSLGGASEDARKAEGTSRCIKALSGVHNALPQIVIVLIS